MSDRKFKAKVGCHFIMKNEESVLDRCLTSMKGCWDEGNLVIMDTGSTDKSIEIAEKHGAIVGHFEWVKDFGRARNASLALLYEKCPDIDYVMWADCDDVIMSQDEIIKYREILDEYLDDPKVEAINFPYIYAHDTDEVCNQGIANFKYHRLRVFKKDKAIWRAKIHEYLESDHRKHVNRNEVDFHHYRDEGKGTQNTKRNLEILKSVWEEATEAEKPRYSFYLGKEYMYSAMWDEAIEMFKTYLPISNFPAEKTRARYEMAVAYQAKGNIEEAKRCAFESIILDERYPDPYVLLSTIAYKEKNWLMCYKWADMATNLARADVYFFSYIPYATYVPEDYKAVAAWHFDKQKGKKAIEKCLFYRPYDRRFLFNWGQFNADIPKIAIVIPTLNREKQLLNCLQKIKENAFVVNYEILIGVDGNEEYYNSLKEKFANDKHIKLYLYEKTTVPDLVESLIDLTDAQYVCYLGDDTEPLPGFLVYAYQACENKNLVCLNDRVWNGKIACHWFAPKALREELGGYFFYKGYNHVGCDNELTTKAQQLNKYVFAEKALVDHVHFVKSICSDENKVAEEDECYKIGWNPNSVLTDRKLLNIRTRNNFLSDSEVLNIHVGCGQIKKEGYINVDKYSDKADIKKDIFAPGLFHHESVDKFLAEHVFEHFTTQEAHTFLILCYGALKKDGTIELAVPDISRIMEVKDEEYRTKVLYGWQIDGMRHCFGYSPTSLKELLEKYCFTVTSIESGWKYDAPECRVIGRK